MPVPSSPTLPLEWLACPVTKRGLRLDGDALVAGRRRYTRHAEFGFWQLLPIELPALNKEEWLVWQRLQANGVVSYEADPTHNLGVGPRLDFRAFSEFVGFHGTVLDVGVGPQRVPTHIEYTLSQGTTARFVGLDPLVGAHPKPFAFVQGMAEYLPFQPGVFNQVLFVTTLDHFVDPRGALAEGRRVLCPGGEIAVWLGEKAPDAPKPPVTHDWYESLEVPVGAHDRFHFKRFTQDEFEQYVRDVDLAITDRVVHQLDAWRRNMFYRLRREGV